MRTNAELSATTATTRQLSSAARSAPPSSLDLQEIIKFILHTTRNIILFDSVVAVVVVTPVLVAVHTFWDFSKFKTWFRQSACDIFRQVVDINRLVICLAEWMTAIGHK